jgi:hypothetical protein
MPPKHVTKQDRKAVVSDMEDSASTSTGGKRTLAGGDGGNDGDDDLLEWYVKRV